VIHHKLGVLVHIVAHTLFKDVFLFIIIYTVFLVAFTVAIYLVTNENSETWTNIGTGFDGMIRLSIAEPGDMDGWVSAEASLRSISYFYHLMFMVMSVVVLMNLVISMFNFTFQEMFQKSTRMYALHRGRRTILLERRLLLWKLSTPDDLRLNHAPPPTLKGQIRDHKFVFETGLELEADDEEEEGSGTEEEESTCGQAPSHDAVTLTVTDDSRATEESLGDPLPDVRPPRVLPHRRRRASIELNVGDIMQSGLTSDLTSQSGVRPSRAPRARRRAESGFRNVGGITQSRERLDLTSRTLHPPVVSPSPPQISRPSPPQISIETPPIVSAPQATADERVLPPPVGPRPETPPVVSSPQDTAA